MKVLITGASGLIGKEVGKILSQNGHEVLALTRDAKRTKSLLPFQATCIEWTQDSPNFTEDQISKLKNTDVVVNLMGESLSDHRWTEAVKKKLIDSRVRGTKTLMASLAKSGLPKTWIQASAIGFYGESKNEVLTESSPKGKGFLADLCDAWEGTLDDLDANTRKIILRTGIVFSHQGGAFPEMLSPLLKGVGGAIGSGDQLFSLIHVEDAARFIVHAVEKEAVKGVYNLVCDEQISQKELTKKLAQFLHVKMGPSVPGFALKVILGEMSGMLLESQPVKDTRFSEVGFKRKYETIDAILKEVTRWHQHPFQTDKSVFIQYAEQFVPKPRDELFSFFSEASNLEALTPAFLNFKIKSVTTPKIEKGTHIEYDLKLHGVPIAWLTDIVSWNPPEQFVDNQLKGPYTIWYHEHRFEPVSGGTLLKDWVRYELPGGKLGQWAALPKVKSDIDQIFLYRRERIESLFG